MCFWICKRGGTFAAFRGRRPAGGQPELGHWKRPAGLTKPIEEMVQVESVVERIMTHRMGTASVQKGKSCV